MMGKTAKTPLMRYLSIARLIDSANFFVFAEPPRSGVKQSPRFSMVSRAEIRWHGPLVDIFTHIAAEISAVGIGDPFCL